MEKSTGVPGQRPDYNYPQAEGNAVVRRNPAAGQPEPRRSQATQNQHLPRTNGNPGVPAASPAAHPAVGGTENHGDTVKKEISKISRAILELSIESYRCFGELANMLNNSN